MQSRILVIDDEETICFGFKRHLENEGYKVQTANNYYQAIDIIKYNEVDVIIVDIILGDVSGINILEIVKKDKLNIPVVMITGQPSIETAKESVRLGAYDYLTKPVRKEKLLTVVQNAITYKELTDREKEQQENLKAIFENLKDGIISVNDQMKVLRVNSSIISICGIDPIKIMGNDITETQIICSGKCLEKLRESLNLKRAIKDIRIECNKNDRPNQVVFFTSTPLFQENGDLRGALVVIRDATEIISLKNEIKKSFSFHNIIGKSSKMQNIFKLIENIKETDTTVLITGETGTGKELLAKAIHYESSRANMPMITVSCSALSEGLLESELFGHVKGAFTGAIKDKIGRFQLAHKGTLLLDEIGDISPLIQLKLLRVLQEKKFEMVGDSKLIAIDVRIIAATNKNLKEKVSAGNFREDLYYRLRVIEINLPPLRERREDIPLLVKHFMAKLSKRHQKDVKYISDDVMGIFMNYLWPGNIRELENTIEHAIVLCNEDVVKLKHLPKELNETYICKKAKEQYLEKQDILKALHDVGWNKAKASRVLGISRPTLYKKIEEFNISVPPEV